MGDVILLRLKGEHGFEPLLPAGTCCAELRQSIRAMDQEGRNLVVYDHVVFVRIFSDEALTCEEPLRFCFYCGTKLIEISEGESEPAH